MKAYTINEKTLLLLALQLSLFVSLNAEMITDKKPKLILQITVDQLRGDLPFKYAKHMRKGGFSYLKEQGIWYKNAHYQHSLTQTAVGHTTLATGAYPSEHGMVANNWYDRTSHTLMYNVADASTTILSYGSKKIEGNHGRSPKNILTSTFSDELALSSNHKSKIFAVSVKDRGAITLAGHAGKAFWFNKESGEFVTSSYYYKEYPLWAREYNKHKRNSEYANKAWVPLLEKSKYMYKDDKKGEVDYLKFGTEFPHKYGALKDEFFNTHLAISPAGDELTLDFAKVILESQKLGQGESTDFLAISFSATDYVGHIFSPSSMEAEDNLLRLDRTLANLFAFVDKKVGLKNTLIVLSADHGIAESASHFHEFSMESKQLYVKELLKDKELLKKLHIDASLVEAFVMPYVYLNEKEITKRGLQKKRVEREIAEKLMNLEGIELAITSEQMRQNKADRTLLYGSARKSYYAKRSGDILLINKAHYIMNSKKEKLACNHGSPWNYDTFVPIVFAGMGIHNQEVFRSVEPNEIAASLSAIVGAKCPSGTTKTPLEELMQAVY